ncbi:MAG: dCTP deaminase, partial [Alphaproteobacteria bacterium]|nr:dCTP deaminase [Alphaproteobacteria bacterium]
MILTGSEIAKNVKEKKIIIEPFNEAQLNPNSYNFTIGNKLLVYEDYILDAKKDNKVREMMIPEDGLTLAPGTIYLACT